jgi:hypothetical protein
MLRVEIVNNVYVCGSIKAGSLLVLCRELIEAGYDPAMPLEAWRGEMLCLRVRSIREGARLRVASNGVGFDRAPEAPGASPVGDEVSRLGGQPPVMQSAPARPLGQHQT